MSSTINVHAANAVIGLKKQRNPKGSGNIWRQNIATKPLLSTSENYTTKSYQQQPEKSESNTLEQISDSNTNKKGDAIDTDSNTKQQSIQSGSGQSNLSSLSLSLPNQSELLPIAEEEKDSPGSGSKLDMELHESDMQTKKFEKRIESGNSSQ